MRAALRSSRGVKALTTNTTSDFQLTPTLPLDSDEVAAFQLTRSSHAAHGSTGIVKNFNQLFVKNLTILVKNLTIYFNALTL